LALRQVAARVGRRGIKLQSLRRQVLEIGHVQQGVRGMV